jgi:formylglycine-generating enzyme required for sulfatase activity
VRLHPNDGQHYIWISPGKFRIGCSTGDRECLPNENPSHDVTLTKGFWLGQNETTVAAWKRYRAATGKKALPTRDALGRKIWNEASADDNLPVVLVTWREAQEFCGWVGGGLPTEAQWEYAARAGEVRARYGDADPIAWFGNNSGRMMVDVLKTSDGTTDYNRLIMENHAGAHIVGQRVPNAWGLYDMLGNVSEWVQDWSSNYTGEPTIDPIGPPRGTYRLRRGGSWRSNIRNMRFSLRLEHRPTVRDPTIGFRCVANFP